MLLAALRLLEGRRLTRLYYYRYIPQIYIKEIAKPLLTCMVEGEEIKRYVGEWRGARLLLRLLHCYTRRHVSPTHTTHSLTSPSLRYLFKGWENYYLWDDLDLKTISAKQKVKYFSRVKFWEDLPTKTYREYVNAPLLLLRPRPGNCYCDCCSC